MSGDDVDLPGCVRETDGCVRTPNEPAAEDRHARPADDVAFVGEETREVRRRDVLRGRRWSETRRRREDPRDERETPHAGSLQL